MSEQAERVRIVIKTEDGRPVVIIPMIANEDIPPGTPVHLNFDGTVSAEPGGKLIGHVVQHEIVFLPPS